MKRIVAGTCLVLVFIQCYSHPDYRLNGPHPYSPVRQIRLTGFSGKWVAITLYNVAGETQGIVFEGTLDSTESIELTRLINVTTDSAGVPDTSFTPWESLADGVYFYRVKTGDTTFTRKMVVLK